MQSTWTNVVIAATPFDKLSADSKQTRISDEGNACAFSSIPSGKQMGRFSFPRRIHVANARPQKHSRWKASFDFLRFIFFIFHIAHFPKSSRSAAHTLKSLLACMLSVRICIRFGCTIFHSVPALCWLCHFPRPNRWFLMLLFLLLPFVDSSPSVDVHYEFISLISCVVKTIEHREIPCDFPKCASHRVATDWNTSELNSWPNLFCKSSLSSVRILSDESTNRNLHYIRVHFRPIVEDKCEYAGHCEKWVN